MRVAGGVGMKILPAWLLPVLGGCAVTLGSPGHYLISSNFPISVEGGAPELLSEFGLRSGESGQEVCRWTTAWATRAHIGGGRYGGPVIEEDMGGDVETGPCDQLATHYRPERALLAAAVRDGWKRALAVAWSEDSNWEVQLNDLGNPLRMQRFILVLEVIREPGPVRSVPPVNAAVLTSDAVKAAIAYGARKADRSGVESATIQHVVRFVDRDGVSAPKYDVRANVLVTAAGVRGICEMKVEISGPQISNMASCRGGPEKAAFGYDCNLADCIKSTATAVR
jgi:hypothetical protein